MNSLPTECQEYIQEKLASQPVNETRIHAKRMLTEKFERILQKNPITAQNILNGMDISVDCDRTSADYGDPTGLGGLQE